MEFTIQKTTCCWIPHSHILMFNQDWNAGPLSKYTTNGFKAKICTFFSIRLWRFILCENWTDSNLQDFSTWIFHQISQKNIARRNLLKLMTCFRRLLCLRHVFDLFLINLWSNGTLHSLHHHLLLRQLVRQQQTPPPWSHLLPVNFVSNFSSGADWKSCSRKIRYETEKNGRISIDLTFEFELSLLVLI